MAERNNGFLLPGDIVRDKTVKSELITGSRSSTNTTLLVLMQRPRTRNWGHALAFFVFVVVVVLLLLVVLADEVSPRSAVVRGRRWGGLGEEREAEGGGGGALLTGGAAAGAMSGADGLEHAAFPLLQHVLLWRPDGRGHMTWTHTQHLGSDASSQK